MFRHVYILVGYTLGYLGESKCLRSVILVMAMIPSYLTALPYRAVTYVLILVWASTSTAE